MQSHKETWGHVNQKLIARKWNVRNCKVTLKENRSQSGYKRSLNREDKKQQEPEFDVNCS